jgi:hypothetical protein
MFLNQFLIIIGFLVMIEFIMRDPDSAIKVELALLKERLEVFEKAKVARVETFFEEEREEKEFIPQLQPIRVQENIIPLSFKRGMLFSPPLVAYA